MSKIKIGLPMNGISINGDQFVCDDSNKIMLFDNIMEAYIFLKDKGLSNDEIELFNFVEV